MPKATMINELYYDYLQTDDYSNIYSENEATIAAYNEALEYLGCEGLPDEIGTYACSREEIGFVNGFRHAMQIMAECVPAKAKVVNIA